MKELNIRIIVKSKDTKDTKGILFERILYRHASLEFPYNSIIDALNVLYDSVPHTIIFEII